MGIVVKSLKQFTSHLFSFIKVITCLREKKHSFSENFFLLNFGTMFFTIWHSRFGALTQQGKTNKTFAFINQVLLCNPNIRQRKSAFFLPIKQNKKLSQWNQNLLLVCPQTCLLPNTFYNCILQWTFEESNNIMIIFFNLDKW